jgi:hypothetical protein
MAGGEFRFGTDSIYMARHQHRPPESTSAKIWITWLHYGCVSGAIASLFNTIAVFRRGKLGLADLSEVGDRGRRRQIPTASFTSSSSTICPPASRSAISWHGIELEPAEGAEVLKA